MCKNGATVMYCCAWCGHTTIRLVHRSIKMKPANVTWHNAQRVWHTLYDGMVGRRRVTVPKFQVGDEVRIMKAKGTMIRRLTVSPG